MKYFKKINKLFKIIIAIIKNRFLTKKIFYITEDTDWVIKEIGISLYQELKDVGFYCTITHLGIKNSTIHYASINTFFSNKKLKLPHKSNRIVVTWFHIVEDDPRITLISEALKFVDIWHTASTITKNKMIKLGIPEKIIIIITLGIDLDFFKPNINKDLIKNKLDIPQNKIVIGSFQKDGNGWGEGLVPKLIKGPDVFCELVIRLAKKYDLFILLTGPSRGYVKNRLINANIPFRHDFLENPNDVAKYFQAIDLYLVTSREEGGPKSILESLASGIPLVSTRVGMAPDVIKDGYNGFLVEVEDLDMLEVQASEIIENTFLQKRFTTNGLKSISNYSWHIIADAYYLKLYKFLLKKNKF